MNSTILTGNILPGDLIIPLLLIAGGLTAGFIIEKIIVSRLRRIAKKTKWEADDVFVMALKDLITIMLGIAGSYAALFNLPFTPEATISIKKGLLVLAVISLSWFSQRLAAGFVRLYISKGQRAVPSTSIFINLTRAAVLLIGGIFVLEILDQPIAPLLTAMGVGGLAVALGLQETISNLFSGLNIIASKKIRPNDFIKIGSGESGFVQDINWRQTSIKDLGGNIIIVPNSVIGKSVVVNHTLLSTEKSATIKLNVSYDSDLDFVEETILDEARQTLKNTEGAVADSNPVVRFKEFGDSGIAVTIFIRATKYTNQFKLKHEFIKNLHKRFKKEKIKISYPTQYVINKKD